MKKVASTETAGALADPSPSWDNGQENGTQVRGGGRSSLVPPGLELSRSFDRLANAESIAFQCFFFSRFILLFAPYLSALELC